MYTEDTCFAVKFKEFFDEKNDYVFKTYYNATDYNDVELVFNDIMNYFTVKNDKDKYICDLDGTVLLLKLYRGFFYMQDGKKTLNAIKTYLAGIIQESYKLSFF